MVTKNLTLIEGDTTQVVVRWDTTPYIYKAITGITKAAPARVTCPSHGIPDGWRVAVVSVLGMVEINCTDATKTRYYTPATYINADTVDLNEVNSSEYHTYTSGGYLQYLTPVDLASYTATLTISDTVGGTVLDTLTSAAGEIVLDNVAKTITIEFPAITTYTSAVYNLDLITGGKKTTILSGKITVTAE